MKHNLRRTSLSALIGTTLAVIPVLALATPAAAATKAVTFQCQAKAPTGDVDVTLNDDIDGTAPATVKPAGALSAVLSAKAISVPSSAGGHTVKEIKDVVLKVPVPANSSYVSASLSGGSNLGSKPTVSLQGNMVLMKMAGPIAGGTTFTMPTLTLNLKAGGSGVIETRLAGTSIQDSGLTFTAVGQEGPFTVDVPTSCFPKPSPVLTSTTIG